MVRLFLFCCLLITSFVRADTIHVYCDDWPGFCHRDGKGSIWMWFEPSMNPGARGEASHGALQTGTGGGVAKGGTWRWGLSGRSAGVHQPDYPDSADYVSVVMQSAGCRTGQGAQPQGAGGALAEGWALTSSSRSRCAGSR